MSISTLSFLTVLKPKKCAHCKRIFQPKKEWAKYHSKSCAQAAAYRRRAKMIAAYKKIMIERMKKEQNDGVNESGAS